MIVYIPTPITSVEQAEALPIGARLMREPLDESDAGGMGYAPYSRNEQALVIEQFGERRVSPKELAEEGWMHLVPVEAEEETVARGNEWSIPLTEGLMPNGDVVPNGWTIHTRFVTPWEPVADPDRRGDCA